MTQQWVPLNPRNQRTYLVGDDDETDPFVIDVFDAAYVLKEVRGGYQKDKIIATYLTLDQAKVAYLMLLAAK